MSLFGDSVVQYFSAAQYFGIVLYFGAAQYFGESAAQYFSDSVALYFGVVQYFGAAQFLRSTLVTALHSTLQVEQCATSPLLVAQYATDTLQVRYTVHSNALQQQRLCCVTSRVKRRSPLSLTCTFYYVCTYSGVLVSGVVVY